MKLPRFKSHPAYVYDVPLITSIAYYKHLLVVIYMAVSDSTTSVQTDGNYKMNEPDCYYITM